MMAATLAIGNIGIGNTSTLATVIKCSAFTKLDSCEIRRIEKETFGAGR